MSGVAKWAVALLLLGAIRPGPPARGEQASARQPTRAEQPSARQPGAAATTLLPPEPELEPLERRVAALLRECREGVLAEPGSDRSWGKYAMALHVHGLHEEARTCYREALHLEPRSFQWAYLLGLVAEELPDPEGEAVTAMRRAAELSPTRALAALRLGDALLKRGRAEEAVAAYREAVTLGDDLSAAHRGLGQALLESGRAEEALAALERAHELHGEDRTTESTRSRALAQLGRAEEARAVALAVRELPPAPEVPDEVLARAGSLGVSSLLCWRRAQLLLEMGAIEAAIANLLVVVEEKPEDPQVHRILAGAYLRAGQHALALAHQDKALRLEPSHSPAWGVLLGLLNHLGETEAVMRQGLVALEHAPSDPQVHGQLALALDRSGRRMEAETHYRRALEGSAEKAPLHYNLGLLLARTGRTDEAVAELRRASELDPALPVAELLAKLGASH